MKMSDERKNISHILKDDIWISKKFPWIIRKRRKHFQKSKKLFQKSKKLFRKRKKLLRKRKTLPEIPDGILNVIPEIEAISVKAKRGRPQGAKNKAKAKPKARQVVIEEAPIEEDEHSATAESSYTPSSPKKDRMVNDVAVEVLRLLQNQTHVRQQKKRAQYASWFQ